MIIQTWGQVLVRSFQDLWIGIVGFLPNVLVSIIIFIVGWVVGVTVGGWIAQLVQSLKLDKGLRSLGFEDLMNRMGYRLNSGVFIGTIVKWFIIVAFLVAAFDVLGLSQANAFLLQILGYLPQVVVAAIILLVAAVVADALKKLVVASAKAAEVAQSRLLGEIVKWAIWISAFFAAVEQLGIAREFFNTILIGLVAMFALAGGIAFGLGGKDMAQRYLEKAKSEMSNNG